MDTFDFADFAQRMAANMKAKGLHKETQSSESLKNIIETFDSVKWDLISSEDIIQGFCNDLKKLLKLEDGASFLQRLFEIEYNLNLVKDKFNESNEEAELPTLEEFYSQLSPILLRALWESYENNLEDSLKVKSIFEALRINLEEELYYWCK